MLFIEKRNLALISCPVTEKSGVGLQAFLSEAEHQPVDEISRAPVEQRDVDLVLENVGGDVTARIPETRLERVLLVHLAALPENVAPRTLAGRIARDIKNWNVRRPAKVNVVMCNDRFTDTF